MIPSILHQIWIGPHEAPLEWMRTWQAAHPTWTYLNHSSFTDLYNQKLYDYCVRAQMFDAAADVARVEMLYRHGGVYIDADSICLRPLGAALPCHGFWAVEEPGYERPFLVTNAFMGSEPRSTLLRRYITALSRIDPPTVHSMNCWDVCGPGLLTRLLAHTDAVILEPWRFFTKTIKGQPIFGAPLEPHSYADHFFSSTHRKTANAMLDTRPYPGQPMAVGRKNRTAP